MLGIGCSESGDFCNKSHVTHISQGMIDELSAAKVREEDLDMAVLEPFHIIEVWFRLWVCVEVATEDSTAHAICPFNLGVRAFQVVSDPSAVSSLITITALVEHSRCICTALHLSFLLHAVNVKLVLEWATTVVLP
jgi:hypothetical protein